jgi:DNA-directed RNA polymerase specialized sigma24 family protein
VRQQRATRDRRRAHEFESFVAGAAGRLLHAATLLTGEPPDRAPLALRLLTAALATTYADWPRLRGEDPYDRARRELASRYARSAWHSRRLKDGVLGPLNRQERIVLVLRLYEGADDEQTAALTGLPVERVRALCARAVATLRASAYEQARRKAASGGRPGVSGGGTGGRAAGAGAAS